MIAIHMKQFFTRRSAAFLLASLFFAASVILPGLLADRWLTNSNGTGSQPAVDSSDEGLVFVLDAGHGGEDGGAIAADGTEEKKLNLAVANTLGALLRLNGQTVVLTRSTDTLLYDYYKDREDYTGYKKMYDLRNRLRIAEQEENSVYVGLHMNKFSDPRYSGLQVYYAKTEGSATLAGKIQTGVKSTVQPDNNRQIKAATSGIYILNEIRIPAVLVECGFLSNPEECAALSTEEYRRQLSAAIFYALCTYETNEQNAYQ
ncbi:MAG: N-acetylmuramoyl-L-alanine amidase [Clostridia bacterium]|nr:N-acetylmuramoyl-L-alanine amidase [Clostridia bacterium]